MLRKTVFLFLLLSCSSTPIISQTGDRKSNVPEVTVHQETKEYALYQKPSLQTLHIVPLGSVSQKILAEVKIGLEKHASIHVKIEEAISLPEEAKKGARKGRYRAEKLLETLDSLPLSKKNKVMGVTVVDIETTKGQYKNWGILGLGSLDGRASVLSTFRMKRKGKGLSDPIVKERLWKVALHELGHTLGLAHCPNKGCIMEDAKGTIKTVDAETALCSSCSSYFESMLSLPLE